MKMRQMEFRFPVGHGGKRKGAGRKSQADRARVGHRRREAFSGTRVVHITCRIMEGLPSLRDPATVVMLFNYLLRNCERDGFRIVEFSIQGNHIHMLCEVDCKEPLSRAMNGVLCGMARQINKLWQRRGRVFADRYHAEPITTPTQCRHTLIYVLANVFKHGGRAGGSGIDAYSTAPWFPFDGPRPEHPLQKRRKPAAEPRTWLLRTGWRKSGRITSRDRPRMARRRLLGAGGSPRAGSRAGSGQLGRIGGRRLISQRLPNQDQLT